MTSPSIYDATTSSSGSYNPKNRKMMNLVDRNGKPSREHEMNLYRPVSPGKNSPSPSRPLLFSPDSRAQAIARGRSELMEMVRHMPESSYELSLKDIVEPHHRPENQKAPKTEDFVGKLKKEESNKFDRNTSFQNKGLFLNMVFPFSFRSKTNKKTGGSNSRRISPKVVGERDWWKRRFTGSSDSDSSRTSHNSGSSTSTSTSTAATASSQARERRRNSGTKNCWHFFYSRRRSKSAAA